MRTRTRTLSTVVGASARPPRRRSRLIVGVALAGGLVAPLVPTAPAGAVSTPAIDAAVAWLETQQKADGGFESTPTPGFETPDAIYALASAGQADATWSTAEALAAVEAVNTGGETSKDPLDSVDDWVDNVQSNPEASAAAKAQQAAKIVVLVTQPLGLSATDFDPSGDTASAVDLVAAITAAAGTGDYAGVPIAGKAYVAWALGALGQTVPAGLVTAIGAAQHADGGYDFSGSPTGDGFDPDITASVIIGLLEAGVAPTNTVIAKAVTGLAVNQQWTGLWAGGFDDGNPNSTALVMLAASALGSDPDVACWRNRTEPRMTGVPYPSPTRALTRLQAPDGHIVGPFDSFGLNSFGTTQAIQALAAGEGATFYTWAACSAPATTANVRIAQAYYVDLLGRVTEPGGAAYWAGQFDAGLSPALLAKRFVGTREYGVVVTEELVEVLFHREPSAAERAEVPAFVRLGLRLELLAGGMVDEEYFEVNEATTDDAAWAAAIFRDGLGRAATPSDVTFIVGRLDAGVSYEKVARDLVLSAEGRGAFVRQTYRDLLRRNPAGSDITFWGGELKRGVSPERLVTLIIGSAEYKSSTAAPA